MNTNIAINIYKKMVLINEFELQVASAINNNRIKCPVYLSIGQESIASSVSVSIPEAQIFGQHRSMGFYLAYGGKPNQLKDELLGLPTGVMNGRMGANTGCFLTGVDMYSHNGLIGENIPIAVGAALGNNKITIAILGDGSAEEDYIYPAMGFAATHNLPVIFICQDNNLAILTPKIERRNWDIADIATSMGILSFDIDDDPFAIIDILTKHQHRLPVFVNCRTCRKQWHVGTGVDALPDWDRMKIFRQQIVDAGCIEHISKIEQKTKTDMKNLWEQI